MPTSSNCSRWPSRTRPLHFDPQSVAWSPSSSGSYGVIPPAIAARTALAQPNQVVPEVLEGMAQSGGWGMLGALLLLLPVAGGVAIAEQADAATNKEALAAFEASLRSEVLVPATIDPGATLAGRIYLHRPQDETSREIVFSLVDRAQLKRYTFVIPVAVD